jgi:poly-gamma-glutamate system protein
MKQIYWRPKNISRKALALISIIAISAALVAESYKIEVERPYQEEKLAASQLALQAFTVTKERRARYTKIDKRNDPAQSGLIGLPGSPITSKRGDYDSKRTSINPNFAAVIVEMLGKAEVQEGDTVAISFSGSFPALNICTLAAVEVLKLKPVILSSVSASEWGANDPQFTWLDMESYLVTRKIFSSRTLAASVGGMEGTAEPLSEEALELLKNAIARNKVRLLEGEDLAASVSERVQLINESAGPNGIKAYINVGGGRVSTGGDATKRSFRPGLNRFGPVGMDPKTSLMVRYSRNGVPIIHLSQIKDLAREFGLPLSPVVIPEPGEGGVFFHVTYNRWLAGGMLLIVLGALYGFIRTPWGIQLLRPDRPQKSGDDMEPMI